MSPAKPDPDQEVLERLQRLETLLAPIPPEVLGQRVRRLRAQQGFSIRDLAERAALSKNSIVRLEQGRGTQPITVLKVCSVLGVHVERLAEPGAADPEVAAVHHHSDDRWFDGTDMGSGPLLGADRPLSAAERAEAVTAGAHTPVNLLQSRLPGGRALPSVLEVHRETPLRSHVGEEFVYVLSGRARLTVGGVEHELGEGESIVFWSAEPHRYAPADPADGPVRLLSLRIDG